MNDFSKSINSEIKLKMNFYKVCFCLILSILYVTKVQCQNFTNGDFSSGSTGWLGSVEVNPETAYGGLNASNKVGEIDSLRFLRQNVSGFTVSQTYTLSYNASLRETTDCNNGTPNPNNILISFEGVAKDSITRTNTTFSLTPETYTFTATLTTHNIKFSKGALNVTTCGILIDDVSISVALPVTFTRISAKAINDKLAIIEWTTSCENNNDFFTIESSNDGSTWESKNTVKGFGTTNRSQNYKYLDTNIVNGASYYRIKQTDFDGKTSFSKVCFMGNTFHNELKIYPNPSNSHFIYFDGVEMFPNNISIFNMEGKLVISFDNFHSNMLDLSSLENGLYEIIIQNEKNVLKSHFILN